jgi:dihydroflavonol-4-reductase
MLARIARREVRFVPPGGATFCDVDDVAHGAVRALERGRAGERYILGGHNLTWSEIYAAIAARLDVPAPRTRVPRACLPALRASASVLDALRLSRPPWAPEVFRAWGWYVHVDSRKAERELGYSIRPLEEILTRAAGPLLAAESHPLASHA